MEETFPKRTGYSVTEIPIRSTVSIVKPANRISLLNNDNGVMVQAIVDDCGVSMSLQYSNGIKIGYATIATKEFEKWIITQCKPPETNDQ